MNRVFFPVKPRLFHKPDSNVYGSPERIMGQCGAELCMDKFVELRQSNLFRKYPFLLLTHVIPDPLGPEKHALDIAAFILSDMPGKEPPGDFRFFHKFHHNTAKRFNGFSGRADEMSPGSKGFFVIIFVDSRTSGQMARIFA